MRVALIALRVLLRVAEAVLLLLGRFALPRLVLVLPRLSRYVLTARWGTSDWLLDFRITSFELRGFQTPERNDIDRRQSAQAASLSSCAAIGV